MAVIEAALAQAKAGRLHILGEMLKVIPSSRTNISQYAPKISVLKIPEEKIGELIGPGGRMIKKIIAETGAEINVEDDGTVTISGMDKDKIQQAVDWVKGLTREVQAGEQFEGTVKRIQPFGAFVELTPGKEGLVHVSKMSNDFVSDPAEVVNIGDKVKVKIHEIDEMGRVNLIMDGVDPNKASSSSPRPPMGGGGFRPRPPMGGGFRPRPPMGGGQGSFSNPRPYRGGKRDR